MIRSVPAAARQALAAAAGALPAYHSKWSRKDYTQLQSFALPAVPQFLRLDYRVTEQLARDWSDLRATVGLVRAPEPPHASWTVGLMG